MSRVGLRCIYINRAPIFSLLHVAIQERGPGDRVPHEKGFRTRKNEVKVLGEVPVQVCSNISTLGSTTQVQVRTAINGSLQENIRNDGGKFRKVRHRLLGHIIFKLPSTTVWPDGGWGDIYKVDGAVPQTKCRTQYSIRAYCAGSVQRKRTVNLQLDGGQLRMLHESQIGVECHQRVFEDLWTVNSQSIGTVILLQFAHRNDRRVGYQLP